MPALSTGALLTLIFGGVGAGTAVGSTIYNDVNKPGAPPTPTAPTPTPPNAQQLLQQKQLLGTADSNTQAATSGAAGDDFRRFIDQLVSGTTGQPGSAGAAASTVNGSQQFTPANSQPTNAAVNGQPINLADLSGLIG